MKYIEKKSVVPIPPASGAVSDTWNINNKTTNAPSIRLVEELAEGVDDLSSNISDINNNITTNYSYIHLQKQGNVAFLEALIVRSGNWTAQDILFKLPIEARAMNMMYVIALGGGSSQKIISISTTGEVKITGDINNTNWLHFGVTFLCQDSISIVKKENLEVDNIYSTEETIVGTWIDGKPIYRKVIDFGALPNNTTKTYDTGDLKIDTFTEPIRGTTESATGFCSGVPFVHIGNNSYGVSINYNKNTNKISVQTGYDRSVQIKTYVILEYTKTTDQ